jgi:hypothetical protein
VSVILTLFQKWGCDDVCIKWRRFLKIFLIEI